MLFFLLLKIPVNDILKNLKKFSSKISEDEFFNMLQEIDVNLIFIKISEYYNLIIERTNLANEKTQLYESLF